MATTATSYEELLKENEELKAQIETAQQNQTKYQQGTTPTKYVSPYAAELERLSGDLKDSTFSYSKEEDPNWQSMRKQYLLAADRTNKDVMAQASAPTGGRASSYAVTAASQAANDMRASLTEQERALYDAAFDRYYQEYSKQLQDYANLVEQDNTNYDRWLQEETQAQELKEQKYDKLVTLIASTGYSPTEEELTAAGMSAGEAKSWAQYYADQKALAFSSGGSGYGYSSGGGSSGTDEATTGAGDSSLLDRIDNAYASGGYEAALREVDNAYKSGEIVGVGGIDTSTGSAGKSAYNSYVNMLETGVDTSGWRDFVRNTYNNCYRAMKNGDTAQEIKEYLMKHMSAGNITSAESVKIMKALGIQ